MTEHYFLKT